MLSWIETDGSSIRVSEHILPACLPMEGIYDGFVADGAMPFVAGWGALGYSKYLCRVLYIALWFVANPCPLIKSNVFFINRDSICFTLKDNYFLKNIIE